MRRQGGCHRGFVFVAAGKFVIGDGDAGQVAGAGLDHQAGQCAGVDAAGQEHAHRHIGHQMAGDRFAQGVGHARSHLGIGQHALRCLAPVLADVVPALRRTGAAMFDPGAVPGRKRGDVAIPGVRLGHAAQLPEPGLAL